MLDILDFTHGPNFFGKILLLKVGVTMKDKKNVLGGKLAACCYAPKAGYFRDGFCRTDASDHGRHIICAQMTDSFLHFTKKQGNDLSTPRPELDFPGLVSAIVGVCVLYVGKKPGRQIVHPELF